MSADILIIDPVSARPYSMRSLNTEPMGGTEATVLRVARGLSAKHRITIAQASRMAKEKDEYGITYAPYSYKGDNPVAESPGYVIVVRAYKILPKIRKLYPDARICLWMHCIPGKHAKRLNTIAVKTETTIITVSDFHKQNVIGFLREYNADQKPAKVIRIYNPIDDNLFPDDTPVDRNKLVYFSSPHKGLAQVIDAFKYIRNIHTDLRLYVANPGYMHMKFTGGHNGIIKLGALPHNEVIRHVREALCVFYPQSNFRETFGLVFAEANAVGTPVLAHPIGSTPEVLGEGAQLVNAEQLTNVSAALAGWLRNGRPEVSTNGEFRCSQVIKEWDKVLAGELQIVS